MDGVYRCHRNYSSRAAVSTSSAWPATLTFGQIRTIRPAASIRKVLRMTPMNAPVHRFLPPGAIGCQHLFGFVGSKDNGELMLRLELVLGRYGVGGNPKDRGSGLGKIAAQA